MFFKKYGDLFVSVFFTILGAALIVGASLLPESAVMPTFGPDFMPRLVGIIILILGVILLIQTLVGLKAHIAEIDASGEKDTSDYARVLGSLAAALVYVNILKPAGFILSTLLYLIVQITILAPDNRRTKKDILLYAVIDVLFTFVVYFLFRYGFTIVLPAGLIAF